MNPHNQVPKPTPISWGKNIHGYLQKLTFNTKIGNQMQNLYCRNVRNVKFPKIVAEKFAFYSCKYTLLFNIKDNPLASEEIRKARERCVLFARGEE